MYKYAIFDLNDTLINNSKNAYRKHILVCQKLGLKVVDSTTYLSLFGRMSFEETIKVLLPEVEFWLYKTLYKKAGEQLPYQPLYEDISMYFTKIRTLGYLIWVLTNGDKEKTFSKLSKLNIDTYKDLCMILHSENMAYEKPDPRVFDYVFNKIWREYDDLIYVWDSIEDYKASRWAGVKFYWVLTWYTSKSEFVSHGLDPSKVLDNINDLILSID